MSNNTFQAADRVLQMLDAFAEEVKELGVSELALRLGIHKSTASRLAATLEGRNFLERVPGTKTLRLGPQMGRLGLIALGSRDLQSTARPSMESLAAETGETVNLAVLDRQDAVNILQVDGHHIVGIGSWTGRKTPLHCVSNGKVLLAFAHAAFPAPPLKAFTKKTITSVRRLRAEIERVRRRGWASNVGETEDGLHAVAAPVFDAFDRCRAALSISGPSFRMPTRRLPALAELCVKAASEIASQLGRGAPPRKMPQKLPEKGSAKR